MKKLAVLALVMLMAGCSSASEGPVQPLQLVMHASRYDKQVVHVCGHVILGDGMCTLQVFPPKLPVNAGLGVGIWLSSDNRMCQQPTRKHLSAKVAGKYLTYPSKGELAPMHVITHASIQPLKGACPGS